MAVEGLLARRTVGERRGKAAPPTHGFVEGEAHNGGDPPARDPDLRQAIGELVTCSRCGGTWAAAGPAASQILAQRFGRLLTWSLAAAGANDWLQAGFAALASKANELEERP